MMMRKKMTMITMVIADGDDNGGGGDGIIIIIIIIIMYIYHTLINALMTEDDSKYLHQFPQRSSPPVQTPHLVHPLLTPGPQKR